MASQIESPLASYVELIRRRLAENESNWDKARHDTGLAYATLYGFVQGHSKYANPTYQQLMRYERACQVLDPTFPS